MTQNLNVPFTWSSDGKSFREHLPDVKDEDNPMVWCEHCKKNHKYYTFTRCDFDKIVGSQALRLADMIDAQIEEAVFGNSAK